MLSTASLPIQIPDIHDLPIDLDDISGRVKKVASVGQRRAMDLAAKTPMVNQKRTRFRLAWPVLAVLAGIGLYMAVRSRRTSAGVGQEQPSGAYARN